MTSICLLSLVHMNKRVVKYVKSMLYFICYNHRLKCHIETHPFLYIQYTQIKILKQ